jgi:hypothetical protein
VIQEYFGRARYYSSDYSGSDRLLVAVTCRIEVVTLRALLDTASEWCVLPWETAQTLGYSYHSAEHAVQLSTRLGAIDGWLERIPLVLSAEEGRTLDVEATWFISEDWPGPPVLGWKGCLERIRFGLDPSEESFYFAEL